MEVDPTRICELLVGLPAVVRLVWRASPSGAAVLALCTLAAAGLPLGVAWMGPPVAAEEDRLPRALLPRARCRRQRPAARTAVERGWVLEQRGSACPRHCHGVISFALTDEQRELQRLAHEFAERELRPIAPEWDEREDFPPDLLAKAARVGLTSYAIPSEHGGGGADAVTSALIAEELAWGCAALAGTIQATMFPVRPLLRFGTDAQRDRYLPMLARPARPCRPRTPASRGA